MADLIPTLRVAQNSDASGVQSETVNSMHRGGNVYYANLRNFVALPGMVVTASGRASFNDGGQGIFQYVLGQATDDNLNTLVVNPALCWPPAYWSRIQIGSSVTAGVAILASANIAANAFVNIYDNAGTPNVRPAKADSTTTPCNGFVVGSAAINTNALVYFTGIVPATVATTGPAYLSDATAGIYTLTPPSTVGHIAQSLGEAIAGVGVAFNPGIALQL